MPDTSIWTFILDAGLIVKLVMLILVIASVFSWTIIFQRITLFKQTRTLADQFEKQFWSGAVNMEELYNTLKNKGNELAGQAAIFHAGIHEFFKLRDQQASTDVIMQSCERAMRAAFNQEMDRLEHNLSFLATVGSTSPYIGLFGTVWGIMTSFQALGTAQQATIAMVAPGISEALIATAFGLFAAIPAVIGYNRFSSQLERLQNKYDVFQDELINILQRQCHEK